MPFLVAPRRGRVPDEELRDFLDFDPLERTSYLYIITDEKRLALARTITDSDLNLKKAEILLEVLKAVSEECRANFVQALSLINQKILVKQIREEQNSEGGASVELTLFPDEATGDIEGDS